MILRRLLLTLPLSCVAVAIPVSTAPAAINVAVGIGDQNVSMFDNPSYQALNLKKTRYFIDWDAITKDEEMAAADRFVDAARGAGVKVLLHISTNNLQARKAKLPSVSQYETRVGALVRHFKRKGVKEWGVWNEANHVTQPTFRSPKRAAEFYRSFKGMCSGCTIVALDVLDQQGVESYIRKWMAAAGPSGRTAKIVGIHNYSEVNRRIRKGTNRYPGTARIIKAVRTRNKVAKFWYTETGGVVNFGRAFPCDENRAVSRNAFMFSLAKKFRKDVRRLYTYNWTGADCKGFDAGIVNGDGSPRAAYAPFKAALKDFKR